MAVRGQFLERPALIKAGRLHLDGLFQRGDTGPGREGPDPLPALIAPAHPRSGGSMASPPVLELVFAFHRLGLPTLRFDFRGVGASQGRATEDTQAAERDFRAAESFLLETTGAGGYIASGYSYGAGIAYRCSTAGPVARLILLAPRLLAGGILSLPPPRCPVLIVAGGADPSCPGEEAGKVLDRLEGGGTLKIIPGADHFFQTGLGLIGPTVRDYLSPPHT